MLGLVVLTALLVLCPGGAGAGEEMIYKKCDLTVGSAGTGTPDFVAGTYAYTAAGKSPGSVPIANHSVGKADASGNREVKISFAGGTNYKLKVGADGKVIEGSFYQASSGNTFSVGGTCAAT